jgi:hypothetical protein
MRMVIAVLFLAAAGAAGLRVDAVTSAVNWIDRVNVAVTGDVLQKTSAPHLTRRIRRVHRR